MISLVKWKQKSNSKYSQKRVSKIQANIDTEQSVQNIGTGALKGYNKWEKETESAIQKVKKQHWTNPKKNIKNLLKIRKIALNKTTENRWYLSEKSTEAEGWSN